MSGQEKKKRFDWFFWILVVTIATTYIFIDDFNVYLYGDDPKYCGHYLELKNMGGDNRTCHFLCQREYGCNAAWDNTTTYVRIDDPYPLMTCYCGNGMEMIKELGMAYVTRFEYDQNRFGLNYSIDLGDFNVTN